MFRHFIALGVGSMMLFACASRIPDFRSIPSGEHKTRGLQLAERSPEGDAETFYRAGGVGYFMTEGGARMPVGNPRYVEADAGDFESLKRVQPDLYSQISPLLIDPEGALSMEYFLGDKRLTPQREYYHAVVYNYASRFNKRMAWLAKQ